MPKALHQLRVKPVSWLKAGVYTLLVLSIYWAVLNSLVSRRWSSEDYSYCYLIPLVVLYIVWGKRADLNAAPSLPSWLGIVPFGIGILLFWLGELTGEFFSLCLSLWVTIVGLVWLHIGWRKIKIIAFALFMALFSFPFPNFIATKLTFELRLISSKLGVWLLSLYGMSAYREGNIIDLGFTKLQVVDACSGLRYVMPLLVMSLLLAYWFKAHPWKKAVLFLSSIPIAIFTNSFRIALTGILSVILSPAAAEGFFHGFSSWLIFLFAIPLLLLEMWVLGKLPPKGPRDEGRGTMEEAAEAAMGDSARTDERVEPIQQTKPINQLFQPVFIVAIVLLGSTLVLSKGIEFREKVAISKPFSQFPMQVGEWKGSREEMGQQFLDILKPSDYVILNYSNQQGKAISFYVAYYQDQRQGESIHSPETCLPAGGWESKEAGNITIPLVGATSLPVNRAFIEKTGERQLVYYWFPQRGRILTTLYEVKLYTLWDALTKHRTDGALVRVITPVLQGEQVEDAEARLQGFTREIVPVLDGFIPK